MKYVRNKNAQVSYFLFVVFDPYLPFLSAPGKPHFSSAPLDSPALETEGNTGRCLDLSRTS